MNIITTYEDTLISYKLYRILPKIYAVEIKNQYDRGMLFCCFQEFYESPYDEIRGKYFTLTQFMKMYNEKRNDTLFRYTLDWVGYNIPSKVLSSALDRVEAYEYSEYMEDIYVDCRVDSDKCGHNPDDFYLIGIDDVNSELCDHEIAHGLYYTNKEYRKEIDQLIGQMSESKYEKLRKSMIKIGYQDKMSIIDDEIQAYMIDSKNKKFLQTFNKYKNHGTRISRSNLEKDN